MRLRRIDIRDFRKIDHCRIEGLGDGLNVIVGDNETGKSTLLAALRAVFFERHRVGGDVARAMQPFGGTLRPTIAVEFEVDGVPWNLSKAFCQRPEANLTGPGERVAGDAVEDRLATLLGFTPPGRGGSKREEHQGTHGLLWVEQGTQHGFGISDDGRNTLASALEREVGQVTGGERGRVLLAAAAERRDAFWTRTDKPRGDFKAQRDAVESLEGEETVLHMRVAEHDGKIARLASVRDTLDRYRRDDRLNKAVTAATAARQALAAAETLAGRLKDETVRRLDAERLVADAAERRARRDGLVAALQTAQQAMDRADGQAADSRIVAEHQTEAVRTAETRLERVRRDREQADGRVRAIEEALGRRQAADLLARQADQLAAAESQAQVRREALARAESLVITPEAVTELAALERALDAAQAEAKAASVGITFEPEGARTVALDGEPQAVDRPLSLARDGTLTLEGFGRLHIRPGGGAADLARKAEAAERALQAAFAKSRTTTVAEAQANLTQKRDAQNEAAAANKAIAALAPKGLDVLRQSVEGERLRLDRPLSAAAQSVAATANQDLLVEAQRDQARYRDAEQRSEAEARASLAVSHKAATEAATLAERAAAARRQHAGATEALTAARTVADDDLLMRRLEAAQAARAAAQATEDAARAAFEAADVDTARLVVERTERAEREIRKEIEAFDKEMVILQTELRASGQDALSERVAAVEGQLAATRRRLAATEVEAAAAKLLHETLVAAQRESKERWLGPVRDRVSPYLKLIQPGSAIVMNEQFVIEGFSRDGRTEAFDTLSMGAREQVAVITRLALADVLRDAGQPAAVILDDALVNTDEIRLDRMHNVLTRAAQNLQILILTCRERDFVGLGPIHRL